MTRAFGVQVDPSGQYCPTDPDYGGDDCSPDDMLDDAGKALSLIAKLLKEIAKLTDQKLKDDLRKKLKDAERKLKDGSDKMNEATNQLNWAQENINSSNQHINDLIKSLNDTKNTLASQLSSLNSLASSISGINAQLDVQAKALADATARFDQALNRNNFPAGPDGLKAWKEARNSASLDKFNIGMTMLDLNQQKDGLMSQSNVLGGQYNNTLALQQAETKGYNDAMGVLHQYEQARNDATAKYYDGAGTYRDGFSTMQSGLTSYQNGERIVAGMVEGSTGMTGLGNAMSNIAHGNNVSAVGDFLNAGLESGLRNGGAQTAGQFGGIYSSLISIATQTGDQTLRQGGDLLSYGKNLMTNAGNTLLGVADFQNVARGVSDAGKFFSSGDTYGATQSLASVTGDLVGGASKVAQTALAFTPLAPMSGALQVSTGPLQTGATGTLATFSEMLRVPISQPTSLQPLTPFGIGGRGIGERPTPAGQPGALTIGLTGMTISAYETGKSAVFSVMQQNPNLATEARVAIQDMAHSGASPYTPTAPTLRAGEITLRSGYENMGTSIGGP